MAQACACGGTMRKFVAAGWLILCLAAASCTTDSSTSPTSNATYVVFFGTVNAGLDVSACTTAVGAAGFCSQTINVKSDGSFHEVWSPSTPNVLQVDGTLGTGSVTAAFKCVANSSVGSMNATLAGSQYTGTATMSGKTVAVRVVKGTSTTCT